MSPTVAPLSGPVAQPVSAVTVRYYGATGGNATWYYWVQALFPGGYSALSPYGVVTQSQPSLNRDMFNVVTWDDVVGAIAYKVWRTPTSTPPATGPYMLAVVGNATTVVTDNGINWQISTDTVEVGLDVNGNANISGSYLVNGTPISGGAGTVASVFGRQGAVVAVAGDYTAAMVSNAVDATQSYPNPTWITSLAASKITGAPVAGSAIQTPWLQNIDGGGFQLANVGKLGVGTTSPSTTLDVVGTVTIENSGQRFTIQRDTGIGLLRFTSYQGGANCGYLFEVTTPSAGLMTGLQIAVSGNTTNVLLAPTAGNVGIGTTSPTYKLDIAGGSVATSQEHISYSGTDTGGYLSTDSSSNFWQSSGLALSAGNWIAKATSWSAASLGGNTFSLYCGAAATVGSTITLPTPTIYVSGTNVGINTASPKNALFVNGNAFFQSYAANWDPGDGSGPGLRIGYNTASDCGYINANNTGVAGKNLTVQPGGGIVMIKQTAVDSTGCQLQVTGGISNNGAVVSAVSDIRLKRDIEPFRAGLAEVLSVNPIRFAYNDKSNMSGTRWVSIDAQAHKNIIPDAITSYKGDLDGQPTELYNFSLQPLVMTLVNAVKELAARLEKLGG